MGHFLSLFAPQKIAMEATVMLAVQTQRQKNSLFIKCNKCWRSLFKTKCQEEKSRQKNVRVTRALQIKESHLGIVQRGEIHCMSVTKLDVTDGMKRIV